ncbi:hypothetical protein [Sphingomonas sp.]|nr:hypothetical protein [Sphingomonas sp.]
MTGPMHIERMTWADRRFAGATLTVCAKRMKDARPVRVEDSE